MIVNSKKIVNLIEEFAPLELCEEWDNSGFLLGNIDSEINKILIALDVDEKVITEAIEKNIDLIISHHPFIFSPISRIVENEYKGKLIRKLIKNDINVYCAHTNLDSCDIGINNYISKLFNLNNVEKLGIGRIGNLEKPFSFFEFSKQIRDNFNLEVFRFSGDMDKIIKRVAICSGAGSDYIELSAQMNADILITGDIKYHEAQKSHELGIIIADCGHFETENIYMEYLSNLINDKCQEKDYDIKVILSEKSISPFVYG